MGGSSADRSPEQGNVICSIHKYLFSMYFVASRCSGFVTE